MLDLLSLEEGSDTPAASGGREDEPDTTAETEGEPEVEAEDLEVESSEKVEEEPDADETEAYEEPEPTRYHVRVEGKDKEVTLDELIRGYSGTEVFTQRTQEAAEQAKFAQQEMQRANGLAAEYEQALQMFREKLAADAPTPPSDDASDREWGTYLRDKAKHEEVEQHYREFQSFRQAEVDRQLETLKATESEKLMRAMPHWSDPAVQEAEKGKLVRYAYAIGLTDDNLAQIYDHRELVVLDKARRWDEQEASRGKVKQRTSAAPTLTPGSSKASRKPSKRKDFDRARARFEKSSGRQELHAAADLLKTSGLLDR